MYNFIKRNISNIDITKLLLKKNNYYAFETVNYYELFDINNCIKIDKKVLAANFRDFQKLLHPDVIKHNKEYNYYNNDILEQLLSTINKGYKTLSINSDNFLYFLKINNFIKSHFDNINDIDFIEEMIEKNEKINNTNNISDLNNLKSENDIIINQLITHIFIEYDNKNMDNVLNYITKLRYYERQNDIIEKKLINIS